MLPRIRMYSFQGYKIWDICKMFYIDSGKPRIEHQARQKRLAQIVYFCWSAFIGHNQHLSTKIEFTRVHLQTICSKDDFKDWESVNVKRSKVEFNCDTLTIALACAPVSMPAEYVNRFFFLSFIYQWVANGRDLDWFLIELAAMVSVAGWKISISSDNNNENPVKTSMNYS